MVDLMTAVAERLGVEDINGAWRYVEEAAAAGVETALLLDVLSQVAPEKWHAPVPEVAQRAAGAPGSADAIGALASALLRAGASRLAALLYGRAVALRPDDPRLLADQVASWERCGDHEAALRSLRASSALVAGDGMLSYLLAFHLAVAGDLDGAAAVEFADAPEATFLRGRIEGILARGRALGMATARARLATVAGVLAMQVSDELLVEGPRQTAEILTGALGALRAIEARVEAVAFLPTSGSEDLAAVVSELLQVPAERFDPTVGERLLVIYDLGDVGAERARSLRDRRDLLIYAHVASSRREHALAPDLLGTYAPAIRAAESLPRAQEVALVEAAEDPLASRWAVFASGRGGDAQSLAGRDRLWAGLL